MKIFPHLLVIASITGASAMAGAAAQTSEPELDLEAIRARAKVEASEADALAASARARAEAVLSQANDSAAEAQAHGKRYTEQAASSARPGSDDVFDFDKMVADAGTMASDGLGEAPRFIAFASLSMPPAALRAMADDVAKAGGVVVLRGLPGGSAKTLTAALAKIADDGGALDAVGIDRSCLVAVDSENRNAAVSARNIENVDTIRVDQLNVFELLNHRYLLVDKASIEAFLDGSAWKKDEEAA